MIDELSEVMRSAVITKSAETQRLDKIIKFCGDSIKWREKARLDKKIDVMNFLPTRKRTFAEMLGKLEE